TLANGGIDLPMDDTYFVVCHFHYVLSIGGLFALYSGFYYWTGNMSGHQYPEWMGKVHFWTTIVGVNMIFFPMHFLGLAGMPRRIPDYPDVYAGWNMVASVGAIITFASPLFFVAAMAYTLKWGRRVADNPWGPGADTLEW